MRISFETGGSVGFEMIISSIALELRSANVYSFDSTQFDFRLRDNGLSLDWNLILALLLPLVIACRLNDEKTIRSNDLLLLYDNSCEDGLGDL